MKNKDMLKFAYLLDQDNYCVENKIFIDLMWSIAKTKMVSADKNGKLIMKVKSYTIRNAGIMFQQIFYWHFNALKNGRDTKYQYRGQNVVKMDYADFWDSLRLTEKEITSANEFLVKSGLVKIVKMRIKVRDQEIYKPSNCYIIETDELERHLENIIEISKEVYADKVEKRKEHNKINRTKKENSVPAVTGETGETGALEEVNDELSTELTLSTAEKGSVPPVIEGTIVTAVTGGTIEPTVTGGTYISNTTYTKNSYANTSDRTAPNWDQIKEIVKEQLTPVSFKTWFIELIAKVNIEKNTINIFTTTNFAKDILENRYKIYIAAATEQLTSNKYLINIDSIEE